MTTALPNTEFIIMSNSNNDQERKQACIGFLRTHPRIAARLMRIVEKQRRQKETTAAHAPPLGWQLSDPRLIDAARELVNDLNRQSSYWRSQTLPKEKSHA